jgi:molecular chaperone HtpG
MISPSEHDKSSETYPISLHVPGILRLLSEHLYSDPKVALRELIQNAYDSCQRRRVEDASATPYVPRIDISLDAAARRLTISDNGSGLTKQEIQDYLATVGRGYTAELRERLQFGGRKEALALIGQFGLGLLSAFIVADELELVTQSYQSGSAAWQWLSKGEETYRMAQAVRGEPGSTFILHIKLAGEFLLNEDLVRRIIHLYADFLEVPIHLNSGVEPVNVIDAPWHRNGDMQSYRQFIEERYGVRQPLAVLPLNDQVETHASRRQAMRL